MGHQLIIISARGTESDDMIDIVTRKFKKKVLNLISIIGKSTIK